MSPNETDTERRLRILIEHRQALRDLARVTVRYQVHNALCAARHEAAAESAASK